MITRSNRIVAQNRSQERRTQRLTERLEKLEGRQDAVAVLEKSSLSNRLSQLKRVTGAA